PGDGDRRDTGLRATRHDDVGAARLDHLDPDRDPFRTRRARRGRRVHSGTCLQVDAHVRRGTVGHQHWHRQRRDLADTVLLQQVVLLQQRERAADTRADGDAEPVGVDVLLLVRGWFETGVGPRLTRCDQSDLLAAVEPAGLHAWELLRRLLGEHCADLHRQVDLVDPLGVELADAATAREQAVPGGRDVRAERRGGAEPGDHDVDIAHWCLPEVRSEKLYFAFVAT